MTIQASLEHLQQQHQQSPYPAIRQRLELLRTLKKLLKDNEAEIIQAISKDFGYRSPYETELAEIFPALKTISYAEKHLANWMQSERRSVSLWFRPAKGSIMYQPLGVVGIIVPWNYPLYLALGPLVAALAAGNRVMLKMSEYTPQFSLLFARLCGKYLGNDWVKVVYGGPEMGADFSRLPFDHLLFTGSATIGKKVMQAASDNLTPVTLELGGQSPVVIDDKYSLTVATERLLFGKLLNAGQTCLAPDHLYLPEAKQELFIEQARKTAEAFYPEWEELGYTSIASTRQFERYQTLFNDARDKGATIIPLFSTGRRVERKVPPALVFDTSPEMLIRQQEIFGPLLPVIRYQDHNEVIKAINAQPRPLALYLFSHDKECIHRYMTETISGGVTLNDTILHVSQESLPFGGVGASGMGHYHGHEGFKTFSKAKSIFMQSRFAATRLMYPPAGRLAKFLLSLMKKS
ncbi:coniferyl aldehyde dehydrogenase [Kangiella shandongensis]|uniref:coniferyl aldehyde dehydrogenase n=1 Tax=Kangiella shandongensis TaxID=2763258 RepID=UPI001CBF0AE8|nr:coniferyl aldehyde dehydrogenase [Kangiella shandongensis]